MIGLAKSFSLWLGHCTQSDKQGVVTTTWMHCYKPSILSAPVANTHLSACQGQSHNSSHCSWATVSVHRYSFR